jgi:threonine/homoserine/homoserine lactone efflux protein
MMSAIEIISLFGIMVVLAAMPSTSVALVVIRSATLGFANGLSAVLGIILGDLIFILLAILGLSFVAETMGSLFVIIQYLGAGYLFWIGITLLKSKSLVKITLDKTAEKRHLIASFLAGFVLTLGDVKAIIFYVSLFPAFINLSSLHLGDILIVVFIMIISVGGVKTIYAFLATKIVCIAENYLFENIAKKVSGGLMIGVGSYLVVKI